MEPKKLYFLLATAATAGAIAGAYGDDIVFSEQTIVGQSEAMAVQEIVRPTPSGEIARIQNQIQTQSCAAIDAKHGPGACDRNTIDYDIVYHRKRGREWVVRRYPQFDHRERADTVTNMSNWIEARLNATYCAGPDRKYGQGICRAESTEYMLRYIRTGGQTRTIVKLTPRVYCTAAPPVDPNPPQEP